MGHFHRHLSKIKVKFFEILLACVKICMNGSGDDVRRKGERSIHTDIIHQFHKLEETDDENN